MPIDRFSGRPLETSQYPFPVQQAIEAKEALPLSYPNTTLNQITLQSLFSRFDHISGASGSAVHNALEFKWSYKLDVVPIRSNRPSIRERHSDLVYATKRGKYAAILEEVLETSRQGRPVLVGTWSIEDALKLSAACSAVGIPHRVLTARNDHEEAAIIEQAGEVGQVTIAARMAGRGVDIRLTADSRALGGLHVIGTERNEDRRLDEQLEGRAGRQGDPGSSRFFAALEDDLMATFGGARIRAVMDRLGVEENVPLTHSWVDQAIRNAQRRMAMVRLGQRRGARFFDNYLNRSRRHVVKQREEIAASTSHNVVVDGLFGKFVGRLRNLTKLDRGQRLAEFAARSTVSLDPAVLLLHEQDSDDLFVKLHESLWVEYQARCELAGPHAAARERMILLRSIDRCWSEFIDECSRMHQSALFWASTSEQPFLVTIRKIEQAFTSRDDKLTQEIEWTSLIYLFHIDDVIVLRELKYWRGLGLTVGYSDEPYPEDGVTPPEDYLRLPTESDPNQELDGVIEPDLQAPGSMPRRRTIHEYIEEYIAEVLDGTDSPANAPQREAVLRGFAAFVGPDEPSLLMAWQQVQEYIRIASSGTERANKASMRRTLVGAFIYFQERGYLPASMVLTRGRLLRAAVRKARQSLADPVVLAQLALLFGGFLLYRFIAGWQLAPPDSLSVNLRCDDVLLPCTVFNLIDTLLLASAASHMSLGIVGTLPFVVTRFVLHHRRRYDSEFESLFLHIPGVLLGVVAASVLLTGSPVGSLSIPLLIVTASITFIVWLIQFTEVMDGLEWVVLGNAALAIAGLLGSASSASNVLASVDRWTVLGAFLLIIVTAVMYSRMSQFRLDIERVGRFNWRTGSLGKVASTVRVRAPVGFRQYAIAGVLVAAADLWVRRGCDGFLRLECSGGLAEVAFGRWQTIAYLLIMCLVVYRSVAAPRSAHGIRALLQQNEMTLAGIEDWREAARRIDHKVRTSALRCTGCELALALPLLSLAWLATAAGQQLEWLYLALMASLVTRLALDVSGRLVSVWGGVSGSIVLRMPQAEIDVDERSRGWNLPALVGGAVLAAEVVLRVLALIGGNIQFFEYVARFNTWLHDIGIALPPS
ncbi:MAG TPA: hypothetical protein VGL99_18995 [Chloroflexota bacterium]